MHNLSRIGPERARAFLTMFIFFVTALPFTAFPQRGFAATSTGHFEVYCDVIAVFLTNIEGVQKLVLFSQVSFPPGTFGGAYFGESKWSDVYVLMMDVSPTANARASPMAEYGSTIHTHSVSCQNEYRVRMKSI
jgi:hypothetical protein